ncbi:MAG: hypothetical protein OQK75_11885 [Gammaproteobacteria bacterium]|nr:hypothetical protein [Gammaproteobacteria bacterium]
MKHFFIPDTQCKPGLKYDHLTAAANYIVDKKPEVIIHAGDHWDMHSLSIYDKGTRKAEGARYQDDIDAGIEGMEALLKPIREYNKGKRRNKQYHPRKIFTIGNHEQRIMRHVDANPELEGKLSYADFNLIQYGWEPYDFLQPVCVDGIYYAHYFYNPNTGRPYAGTAHTKINNIGFSFTMGHVQGKDLAEKHLSNGKTLRGLVAGSFYEHDEGYKGYQGNHHWRGCIMKTEVNDGDYCLVELSLRYLKENWL